MARGRINEWTTEEDEILKEWWPKNRAKAVDLLGRTHAACKNRWQYLGRASGFVPLGLRECHEKNCHNLTTDYRCTKCQQKWKDRNEVCSSCVDDGWV